jgi:hypothetical protein
MTRRLVLTAGIPIIGLVVLFAGLALATRDLAAVTIEYRGEAYTGGRVVSADAAAAEQATPTDERVGALQVWIPAGTGAVPALVFLLRADGRFHRYERSDG